MANKDTLTKMFENIRDERTTHANTARRIGNAFLSMLDFASSTDDSKLSSVHDDIAQGFITFVKGLMSNQLAQLKGGATFGSDGSYSFDKDGNLVIESASSRDFDEILRCGFGLKRNPTSGKYTLSISDLFVWGRMVINALEVRKKYSIGGNVYLSGASSKIQHVEKVYSEDGATIVGYKCYILKDDGTMATQNDWVVGDQALCQTFDIEEGVYPNVSNQYYWRLVTQVSDENVAITEKYIDKDGNEQVRELYEGQKFAWIVLSKDDCEKNSGIPASGDTIVLDGHRLTENENIDYTKRTNVLMLETTGPDSPRIIALTGVVDYKHTTDNEVFILSPQKVIFVTEYFELRTASGESITFVHFMGPWSKGTEYHYYDQVSHANALWTCIVEKGISTIEEPTDSSEVWRKEMSGIKGDKGDDAVMYTLEASPNHIRLNFDGSINYTNGYTDKEYSHGNNFLVVRGYKIAGGSKVNMFATDENPISVRLVLNNGDAYYEYTAGTTDNVGVDFTPEHSDSYGSLYEEINNNGLKSARVIMFEGEDYATGKVLATLDIPVLQDGEKGDPGKDGKDAIHWELSPSTLTYSINNKGNITGLGAQNACTIKVYKGSEDITSTLTFAVESNLDTYGCTAAKGDTGSFYITAIKTRTIDSGIVAPVTSGSFFVTFAYGGVTYRATINFQVDVSLYTGEMMLNNKQFGVTLQEVSNKADKLEQDSATKDELTQAKTELTQTARKFAVEASENAIGRRNLLGGTQFLRQSQYWAGNDTYKPRICVAQGYGGTNAVKVVGDSEHYQGLNYNRIPIDSARTYTVSMLVKKGTEASIPNNFILAVFQRTSYDTIADEQTKYYVIDNASTAIGEWYLFTKTFTVADDTKWLDIVFALSQTEGTVYFCRPMLEEGDTYNGWTPSKLDYDYVGGNMLDDTMTLSPNNQQSNLEVHKSIAANTYEGAYAVAYGKADDSNGNMDDFLQFSGENIRLLNLEKGKDYVLSFLARGTGQLNTYMYYNSHQNVFTENIDGDNWFSYTDGYNRVRLTSEWKRYWVHWRIEDYTGDGEESLPKRVLFRAITGCEAWVTQPKLEEGATPTAYTEKKTDLIDKATAKAAGLEITSDGVLLYGEKISVKNGTDTAAMFQDGAINANLINVDTLNIHHVWAKDANNENTLAHFGNYEITEAKDGDGNQCPLWVGSSTAGNAPFRVSKDGYMYVEKGAFGVRYSDDEDGNTTKKYGRLEITDKGLASGEVFKEDSMKLTDTLLYLIKEKGAEEYGGYGIFLNSHGETLPVPGVGDYCHAFVRVDAIGKESRYSNVCYYADAKNGVQNYALFGNGDVAVDGGVYGYKYSMINMNTKNVFLDNMGMFNETTYNEVQKIDSLTLLVNSKNGLALALPTLGTIQQMLFGSYSIYKKFCVRLTIVIDVGSTTINLRGRCTAKDSAGVALWNNNQLPLMFNWNGSYVSDVNMAEGDSFELLLTYDPDKSYTAGSLTQPYVARIINGQN